MGGLAGTGKTWLVQHIIEALPGASPAFCAPTNKAANVLAQKLQRPVMTVHGLVLRPEKLKHHKDCKVPGWNEDIDGPEPECHLGCGELSFSPREEMSTHCNLVVVDEASMVNREMFEVMMSHGKPVLWIGDHGQLPPVKSSFSLMDEPDFRLEEIHRQAKDSPIVQLAHWVRTSSCFPDEWFWGSETATIPPEDRDHVFLCGYNETRVLLNRLARAKYERSGDLPEPGDRVIALETIDRHEGVVNGATGTVRWSTDGRMAVDLDGGGEYEGDYAPTQFHRAKGRLQESKRHCWDYAYALTVHKAQGSEFGSVTVVDEPVPRGDAARWRYTAITRASEHLRVYRSRGAFLEGLYASAPT